MCPVRSRGVFARSFDPHSRSSDLGLVPFCSGDWESSSWLGAPCAYVLGLFVRKRTSRCSHRGARKRPCFGSYSPWKAESTQIGSWNLWLAKRLGFGLLAVILHWRLFFPFRYSGRAAFSAPLPRPKSQQCRFWPPAREIFGGFLLWTVEGNGLAGGAKRQAKRARRSAIYEPFSQYPM